MAEIVIEDYVPVVPVNPYAELIDALIKAGEGKNARVTVTRDVVSNTKKLIRQAANAQNLTAANPQTIDDVPEDKRAGTDLVSLIYILRPKTVRKPKDTAESITDADAAAATK